MITPLNSTVLHTRDKWVVDRSIECTNYKTENSVTIDLNGDWINSLRININLLTVLEVEGNSLQETNLGNENVCF